MREIREATDVLMARYGEPTGEAGKLAVDILRTIAMKAAIRTRQRERVFRG